MAHKQSRSLACPIGKGAQSAHGNGQPNPSRTCPDHVRVRPPADDVDRGALPEWVRRLAANPERTASSPDTETTPGSPEFLTVAELAVALRVSIRTLRRRLAAWCFRVARRISVSSALLLTSYDEPEILPSSSHPIFLRIADARQSASSPRGKPDDAPLYAGTLCLMVPLFITLAACFRRCSVSGKTVPVGYHLIDQ
jgi:hypothetical protein